MNEELRMFFAAAKIRNHSSDMPREDRPDRDHFDRGSYAYPTGYAYPVGADSISAHQSPGIENQKEVRL